MTDQNCDSKCWEYLKKLCEEIPERCVGSEGNRFATDFFEEEISLFGWKTHRQEFDAIDWEDGGATLTVDEKEFEVFVSPYSLGCDVHEALINISSLTELQESNIQGKIVFLHGDIAKEQLMPKNFVFYNPAEHKEIISLIEKGQPSAIICSTNRNAALAGGVYPFPLIEDGDFDIPSVFMTEEEGQKLLACSGSVFSLKSISKRIPSTGCNVVARKGKGDIKNIVITAHIDAKKGTPGAIDNATGIAVLLLLAELLKDYDGRQMIEIVALNGEDYYAVPGQMSYIQNNQNCFNDILLNINIDGAGYKEGKSAFSFFNLSDKMGENINNVVNQFDGIVEGPQWVQGDHSIFVQYGCPAIAVSSKWFLDNINTQDITHTDKDSLDIVDSKKIVEIAKALRVFLMRNEGKI